MSTGSGPRRWFVSFRAEQTVTSGKTASEVLEEALPPHLRKWLYDNGFDLVDMRASVKGPLEPVEAVAKTL